MKFYVVKWGNKAVSKILDYIFKVPQKEQMYINLPISITFPKCGSA